MPPEQNVISTPEQKGNGALVGSIIIIIILIIGGIYLWQSRSQTTPAPLEQEVNSLSAENELEAELESMDLESLDSEI